MAAGPALLTMLETTQAAEAMRGSAWLYPIVEIVHIVGFSVLVGSVAMFDLRVLGFARAVPVLAAGRMLLPWSLASLLVIVPAGLLLFTAHPHALSMNKVFQLKLLLIATAGLNLLSSVDAVDNLISECNRLLRRLFLVQNSGLAAS